MSDEKLSDAIDLSHHLSQNARSRGTSPLKFLQRYYGQPGLISLAGGLPSPTYFPLAAITGDALVQDSFAVSSVERSSSFSWLWNLFSGSSERTSPVTVKKYAENPGDLSLETALQYGLSTGTPQLNGFINEFTTKVYQPNYKNFTTLVHTGNTDGWSKAVQLLCSPGDGVLTEATSYPSAMATMHVYGAIAVPVAMDGQGMRADALRTLLEEWDEDARGMARPHIMYTIPIGQNPTGATMLGPRKKAIYDICVDFDIVIVEDDPYTFLLEGEYVPKNDRQDFAAAVAAASDEEYIASIPPTYLRYDYQGRVIRLDTFSKTIAPGCRLGWFTCNPLFSERLQRISETSTQAPCGFGQTMVASILLQWQFTGYIRWLRGLQAQYTQRRDSLIDSLAEEFNLYKERSQTGFLEGSDVFYASFKPQGHERIFNEKRGPTIFSFVPPSAGMFIWVGLHLESHPEYNVLGTRVLQESLWEELAKGGVLFAPGFMFNATMYNPIPAGEPEGVVYFRISFSNSQPDEMKRAIGIFAKVLRQFVKGSQI